MKNIYITGATGFFGQHLCFQLESDYHIIGTTRNKKLKDTSKIEYITGDMLDEHFLYSSLEQLRPDVIIHLASIAKSWDISEGHLFQTNLNGTLHLYKTVVDLKSKYGYHPKIFYISSSEIYGATINPENIVEESPFFPISSYGVTKVAADRLSYQFSQNYDLDIYILRPFPNMGPGQKEGFFVSDMASQIARIESNIQQNEILMGNLNATRDYLDIRDTTQACKMLLSASLPKGEAINICSGKGVRLDSILNLLLSKSTMDIKLKEDDSRMRPTHIPILVGNNQRLKSYISWDPSFKLEDTLTDILNFWREYYNNPL